MGVLNAQIEAKFLGWVVDVAGQREVGDRQAVAGDEGTACKSLVHDAKRGHRALSHVREYRLMRCWEGEGAKPAIARQIGRELVVVEQQPANYLIAFTVVDAQGIEAIGQVKQDDTGLGQSAALDFQNRDLAHFVYVGTPCGLPCLIVEEFDLNFFPIGAHDVQGQCYLERIPRLLEAVEPVGRHDEPFAVSRMACAKP